MSRGVTVLTDDFARQGARSLPGTPVPGTSGPEIPLPFSPPPGRRQERRGENREEQSGVQGLKSLAMLERPAGDGVAISRRNCAIHVVQTMRRRFDMENGS